MQLTTFLTNDRIAFTKNKLFKIIAALFVIIWIAFYATALDKTDWWIENILVFIFIITLASTHKRFLFSDVSLVFLFLFLFVHIYGAQAAYTHNALGEFFRETWQLKRNPYDRIVHFSFGFLLAYPAVDLLYNKFALPQKWVGTITNMGILCLATIFELIEWGVSEFTTKETGETYVATQGDVWDAQKDIILALIGSMIVTNTIKYFRKNINKTSEQIK
jgi:putative membrane protein